MNGPGCPGRNKSLCVPPIPSRLRRICPPLPDHGWEALHLLPDNSLLPPGQEERHRSFLNSKTILRHKILQHSMDAPAQASSGRNCAVQNVQPRPRIGLPDMPGKQWWTIQYPWGAWVYMAVANPPHRTGSNESILSKHEFRSVPIVPTVPGFGSRLNLSRIPFQPLLALPSLIVRWFFSMP